MVVFEAGKTILLIHEAVPIIEKEKNRLMTKVPKSPISVGFFLPYNK
jgi:hypothetical protein